LATLPFGCVALDLSGLASVVCGYICNQVTFFVIACVCHLASGLGSIIRDMCGPLETLVLEPVHAVSKKDRITCSCSVSLRNSLDSFSHAMKRPSHKEILVRKFAFHMSGLYPTLALLELHNS